jgi:hypothetical protein
MSSLAARLDSEWRSFTPLHEHALDQARHVAAGREGPFAGAIVGVYGSGKSTLAFALLREAPSLGAVAIWDEAAPFLDRLVPAGEPVLPQTFAARVLAWIGEILARGPALGRYLACLEGRGHGAIAAAVRARIDAGAPRVLLILDEVEQAHELLRRRVAADDGQPLRALIDACGPERRLLLTYAPESYHSVGDADRGRLAYLPVPALDVASIQASFGLTRGEANFVWWVSRGRARGVMQAVRSVVEPLRRGAFDRGLDDLGDALDALPGVFGVPAILRAGLSHAEARALLDLVPRPIDTEERGIACDLADRSALADRLRAELARRVDTRVDLLPVANELCAVLAAVGDDDERAYLTLDDFCAALRTAEARAIESGRQREPIERFVTQAVLVFPALGEMGPLPRRLRFPLATLAEERFPSPFTDPYLPLESGRVPSDAELGRRLRERAAHPAPLLVSRERGFLAFASETALAAWIEAGGLDAVDEPARAVIVASAPSRPPLVALAEAAGRVVVRDVGPFHATFLQCLALRSAEATSTVEALAFELRGDRQLARKIAWHLDRISLVLREARPRPSAAWAAAARFVRDEQLRGALGKLKADSPALLGLLVPLCPPPPSERRLLARVARLCEAKGPLRRAARTVNPGGRLSGAAVVVDELLPLGANPPRWTERKLPGVAELSELLDVFAAEPTLRARLARWLFPEDPERLAALFAFHQGALPDVSEEQAQLDALQGLSHTMRRADAILADLQECTGKPRDALRGLRLGNVTDQVRSAGGPVAQLHALGAEIRAEEPGTPWVRLLALWICGVFADRLLGGVEKEQAELAEWEAAATAAKELGLRAREVERALTEASAHACAELLQLGRRRIGNHVETRESLARELLALRAAVGALEPLAQSLRAAAAALAERGVSVTEAMAVYLPDEDAARSHLPLLRRVPELLDEIDGPCPSPAGRSLPDYAELLRRHAEATRAERLRMRLEAALDITVAPELRLDAEAVASIERAFAALDDAQREALRAEIQARPVRGADELERWIDQADVKARIVGAWAARPEPLFRAADARVGLWSRHIDVAPELVREADRSRGRAREILHGLPSMLRPAVREALVAGAAGGDAEHVFARLDDEAQRFAADLGGLVAQLRAAGVALPAELAADAPALVLEILRSRVEGALADREAALAQAREVGAALARWGEKPAAIPAEVNLAQAARLSARELERLRAVLRRQREDLLAWLAASGLPAALSPVEHDDSLAFGRALEAAREQRLSLAPHTEALARLGVAAEHRGPAEWGAVRAAVLDRLRRAGEEQRALGRAYDESAERARRLGGSPAPNPVEGLPLRAAAAQVEGLSRELERLRAQRLRDCSAEARAAYAAIRSGDVRSLPPALAELVRLGLVRTLEDGR